MYMNLLEDKVNSLSLHLQQLNQCLESEDVSMAPSLLVSSTFERLHSEYQTTLRKQIYECTSDDHSNRSAQSPGLSTADDHTQSSTASLHSTNSEDASTQSVSSMDSSSRPSSPARTDLLKQLVDAFLNNSQKRTATFDSYMSSLLNTIMPGLAFKFALWGLSQNSEFYGRDSLWHSVMGQELAMNDGDLNRLLQFRPAVRELVSELKQVVESVQSVRALAREHVSQRHRAAEELTSTLSPTQFAAFSRWAFTNPAASSTLDSIHFSATSLPSSSSSTPRA